MSYYFGVEIELIAKPRTVQEPLLRRAYYEKLARSLNRHGLWAIADKLDGSRYCKHPEHYDKWWITRDGSLKDPAYPRIPLEAVSPILWTGSNWEYRIDKFWDAWDHVFRTPDASRLCGSHIHVSPYPSKAFTLAQLKAIALCSTIYEYEIQDLLPDCRVVNKYCRKNTSCSKELRRVSCSSNVGVRVDHTWYHLREKIHDKQELRDFMQNNSGTRKDRFVLWNFDNTLPGKSGSIEFRGGHGLRGPAGTRLWISFVVAFIHFSLESVSDDGRKFECGSIYYFWKGLTKAARALHVRQYLPSDWRELITMFREHCYEEYDSDDDSSIMSKGD